MENLVFIEDIFTNMVDTLTMNNCQFQRQDSSAAISFYNTIFSGQRLTQNQANYILRLLEKYKNLSAMGGFDYSDKLSDPKWKNPFRVIDMSRRAFVEIDNECPWVCLQFPYQLKTIFEEEVLTPTMSFEGRDFGNVWDKDRRLRMLSLYEHNIIKIYEFVKDNNFEIDETFYNALAAVEEIWQNQDSVLPTTSINDGKVELVNANDDAINWFNDHKTNNTTNDLLLAKSMGYIFNEKPTNKAQKIAGTKSTTFYTSNYKDFFDIAEEIDGKVCIILDRAADALNWLKTLSMYIDSYNLTREDFKVCFRESNKEHPEFNDWVKDNGFGGKVNEGKYLIFKHKPAKWLFSNDIDVKILVTNNVYPSTSSLTKTWLATHPFVLYIDTVKPSNKGEDIVEL